MTTTAHKIAVLPGDGIGPEVVDATLMVLDAVQKTGLVHLEYLKGDAGFDSIRKFGTNLPEKTVEMMKRTSACLKGPMTTPEEPGTPRSAAVTMRSLFNLYANVRPARTLPNVTALNPGIDLIVVRENTEGLYSGKEFEVTPGVGVAMKIITRAASERIAKFALDLAASSLISIPLYRRIPCCPSMNVIELFAITTPSRPFSISVVICLTIEPLEWYCW